MGDVRICGYCSRNRKLVILLIFLLVSTLTNVRFTVQGRVASKLAESAFPIDPTPNGKKEKVVAMVGRRLIGSRPPRCERKCSSCGHCEAIQVPVAAQLKTHVIQKSFSTIPTTASSRGEDISNYKPICWKCKCGDFIFNP
ncbi:hypothetical protein NMG60_11016599 [Bertholletia excelsa]